MRSIAQVISLLFHPIISLIYVLILVLLVNPFLFGYNSILEGKDLLLFTFILVVPIPIVTVLMMKGLGLTKTVFLHDRQERIGPYIVTGIVYLSLYVQLVRSQTALVFQAAVLGALIAIFTGFFINNFTKISMHAAGMGGLVAFTSVLILKFSDALFSIKLFDSTIYELPTAGLLPLTIIFAGMVGTARCLLKEHSPAQVYTGFVVGFLGQLVAFNITQ